MKILVIEDDEEAAGYLVRALTEAGHTPDHAVDGEDGLDLARGQSYDVLIVDRMIPKIDGLAVIEASNTTLFVHPGWHVRIDEHEIYWLTRRGA